VAIGALGEHDWHDREKAREYVFNHLGRRAGATFLTELSPVPSAKLKASWNSHPVGGSLDTGLQHLERWKRIRTALAEAHPKIVVCNGLQRRQQFQELLEVPEWVEICGRLWRASSSPYFLLPFFGNGQKTGESVTRLVQELRKNPHR
jgi:hypothetical protein